MVTPCRPPRVLLASFLSASSCFNTYETVMSIEKADEDLGYLLHQGKVRVSQSLWLANLENHVLEDQEDGKHGDDDNYNDDDEVVDYEDDQDDEDNDCEPPWSRSLSSKLEDLAKMRADRPLGAGLCRTFSSVFISLFTIVIIIIHRIFSAPALWCRFVSYLCMNTQHIRHQ